MSAVDEEALTAVILEQDQILSRYPNNPSLKFDSCFCVVIYQQRPDIAFGSEESDDKIVAVYACPLHENDGDPKKCCREARDDCRKLNKKFGNLNREMKDEEKTEIAKDKQAHRDEALRKKNRKILERMR